MVPSLMFTLGLTAKSYIMNLTLMANVGDAAVATMNVLGTVCGILGAVPQGCQNAFIALASLYYGDNDRFSFRHLAHLSLKYGIFLFLKRLNHFFQQPLPIDIAAGFCETFRCPLDRTQKEIVQMHDRTAGLFL